MVFRFFPQKKIDIQTAVARYSSVGRAIDCRSIGHLFKSGWREIYFENESSYYVSIKHSKIAYKILKCLKIKYFYKKLILFLINKHLILNITFCNTFCTHTRARPKSKTHSLSLPAARVCCLSLSPFCATCFIGSSSSSSSSSSSFLSRDRWRGFVPKRPR